MFIIVITNISEKNKSALSLLETNELPRNES